MRRLIASAIVVLALAGCGGGSSSNGITFSPTTESCASPAPFTTTMKLPSSVKDGDKIASTLDGKSVTTATVSVSNGDTQQADGSWTVIYQNTVATLRDLCTAAAAGGTAGMNPMGVGSHTEQMLDSSGKVLAQGSYTVTQ